MQRYPREADPTAGTGRVACRRALEGGTRFLVFGQIEQPQASAPVRRRIRSVDGNRPIDGGQRAIEFTRTSPHDGEAVPGAGMSVIERGYLFVGAPRVNRQSVGFADKAEREPAAGGWRGRVGARLCRSDRRGHFRRRTIEIDCVRRGAGVRASRHRHSPRGDGHRGKHNGRDVAASPNPGRE
jgi:hypothetical protein